MKKAVQKSYEQLAGRVGLQLDAQSGMFYGESGGYDILMYAENVNYPFILTVAVSARRLDGQISKEEGKAFKKEHKFVKSLRQDGNLIKMGMGQMNNQEKLAENVVESLRAFTGFLSIKGFTNCCQTCGNTEHENPTNPCVAGNAYMQLCNNCFISLQQSHAVNSSEKKQKNENVIGGIVGALIGSLIGVACIVLLGQLGYVAAASGVVMAVCTMKGYELLGSKLSTRGIIISTIIMLLMTYIGNQLDWAVTVVRAFDVDIATAFSSVNALLENEVIESGIYWGNLVLVYLFALGGAIPTVYSTLKNQGRENVIYRLGE